jgi:hypothetical protein
MYQVTKPTMTTTFITKEEYKGFDLVDVLSYVDTKLLRKKFKKELAKMKVLAIGVRKYEDPEFKNIQNKDIPFQCEVACRPTDDGAFLGIFGMWWYLHPVGDAFIVIE